MATEFTNFMEDQIINVLLRAQAYTGVTVHVALLTADPTETGSLASEVSGGGYARQPAGLTVPTPPGESHNGAEIIFPVATAVWGTITHVGLMNALTGGNMLMYSPLDVAKTIGVGDQFRMLVNDFRVIIT